MAALDTGSSDYDSDTLDTAGTAESTGRKTSWSRANGMTDAAIKIQTKLGVALDGSKADLATRLLVAMDAAGLLKLSDVVQVQYDTDNDDSAALTTNMVLDDSIPQNDEGSEVLTQAITPKSTTSILEIVAILHVAVDTAADDIITALFVDSTADALAASSMYADSNGKIYTITLRHLVVAGSTSARTYKIRVGGAAQDIFLNGTAASTRSLGGVLISSLRITEWQV